MAHPVSPTYRLIRFPLRHAPPRHLLVHLLRIRLGYSARRFPHQSPGSSTRPVEARVSSRVQRSPQTPLHRRRTLRLGHPAHSGGHLTGFQSACFGRKEVATCSPPHLRSELDCSHSPVVVRKS